MRACTGDYAGGLRAAFAYATFGPGAYPKPVSGAYHDYAALMAFERHWIGARRHRNDGQLLSETATNRAERVGKAETLSALRLFVISTQGSN